MCGEFKSINSTKYETLIDEQAIYSNKKYITPFIKDYMDEVGAKSYGIGNKLSGTFPSSFFIFCNLFFSKNAFDTDIAKPKEWPFNLLNDAENSVLERNVYMFAKIRINTFDVNLNTDDVECFLTHGQRFYLQSIKTAETRVFIKNGHLIIIIPNKEIFGTFEGNKIYEDACFLQQLISLAGNEDRNTSFQMVKE